MSLKGTAKATLAILDSGSYTTEAGLTVRFKPDLDRAVAGTCLYTPSQLRRLLDTPGIRGAPPCIQVSNDTTQIAARRLTQVEGIADLVLLNFASARNPGGGFLRGAKAQEEDLARCSGLYPCLMTQPRYYEENRARRSLLYTHHMIYSPNVPWFRTVSRNLLDSVFLASVITAPAPNAGEVLRRSPNSAQEIEACLRTRCGMVLALAGDRGHRNLLLGAWGCGVFRNDPSAVADGFGFWLESSTFEGSFDRVHFAVLDTSPNQSTFHAFQNRFPEQPR